LKPATHDFIEVDAADQIVRLIERDVADISTVGTPFQELLKRIDRPRRRYPRRVKLAAPRHRREKPRRMIRFQPLKRQQHSSPTLPEKSRFHDDAFFPPIFAGLWLDTSTPNFWPYAIFSPHPASRILHPASCILHPAS
jgi:hypothetical protein